MNTQENLYDVVLDHISVAYEHKIVLKDITFSIPRGGFWGILGPNGSGKSTLIKTILGLIEPVSGTVKTLGKIPAQLHRERALIGYVAQHTNIDLDFPIHVLEAVTMGLYGRVGLYKRLTNSHHELALHALERVGLADQAQKHISALSGGQRQRVLIARALVVKPQLLILDEPTSSLDLRSSDGLYEWLHGLHANSGMTIMLVSHDVGVVSKYVHSVACLNGTLVAHGRPSDVFHTSTLEATYGCGAILFEHGHIPHMVVTDALHPEAEP